MHESKVVREVYGSRQEPAKQISGIFPGSELPKPLFAFEGGLPLKRVAEDFQPELVESVEDKIRTVVDSVRYAEIAWEFTYVNRET